MNRTVWRLLVLCLGVLIGLGAFGLTRLAEASCSPFASTPLLAASLYGHEPAGDGRVEWGRRQRVARGAMI
jgi:hypothetical protein